MAIFIPKHRLGSRQEQHRNRLTQRIEGLSGYKAIRDSLAEAKAKQSEGLKEKYESNAEVQRWRTQMTAEEKARSAIERMVPTTKQITEMRTGEECSYEDARKVAEEIAYKAERQKKGE